jgi:hypothetical protein
MQAWHVAGMHDEGDMILHEPGYDGLACSVLEHDVDDHHVRAVRL